MKTIDKKSTRFTAYNQMKNADRNRGDKLRTNRALGLVQSKEKRPYRTSADCCICPDFQIRTNKARRMGYSGKVNPCKHMRALIIEAKAISLTGTKSDDSLLDRAVEAYNDHDKNWHQSESVFIWKKKVYLKCNHGFVKMFIVGKKVGLLIGLSVSGNLKVDTDNYNTWIEKVK